MDFVQPGIKWSGPRHTLIGAVADQLLMPNIRTAVRDLLGGTGTLQSVADWADRLKSNPPADDETKAFLSEPANKSHGRWHYINLPFGAAAYDPATLASFIPADGAHVVGKLIECALAVVTPTPRISRVNGLRWVAHLVGDMHQPLHLGCGYIDATPKLTGDPQAAVGLASDRGGNDLQLPINESMHSYWDDRLGDVTPADVRGLAQTLPVPPVTRDTVPQAVVQWVNDTLPVCRSAYASVKIVGKQGDKFRIDFDGGLAAYAQRNELHVVNQMAKAAVRLAALVTALVS